MHFFFFNLAFNKTQPHILIKKLKLSQPNFLLPLNFLIDRIFGHVKYKHFKHWFCSGVRPLSTLLSILFIIIYTGLLTKHKSSYLVKLTLSCCLAISLQLCFFLSSSNGTKMSLTLMCQKLTNSSSHHVF